MVRWSVATPIRTGRLSSCQQCQRALQLVGEDAILPLRLPWLPPADIDEERRLLYVGMTRAKQRLVLVAARRRNLLGRAVENRACPFLDDLPPGLLLDQQVAARRRRPRQLSLI